MDATEQDFLQSVCQDLDQLVAKGVAAWSSAHVLLTYGDVSSRLSDRAYGRLINHLEQIAAASATTLATVRKARS